MRTHQDPLFRKVIAPWYDSEIACVVVIVFMLLILCFGGLGVSAALDYPAYQGVVWIPILLILMSSFVLVSTIARLVGRSRKRYPNLS